MLFASAGAASSGNGGNFLIPNGTFVVELVIFLVVLGIVAKWILPPLKAGRPRRGGRGFTSRSHSAEEARAESQNLLAERDRVLAEARAKPVASSTTPTRAPTRPCRMAANGVRRSTTGWSRPPGPRPMTSGSRPARSSSGGSTRSWHPPPSGCSEAASTSSSTVG